MALAALAVCLYVVVQTEPVFAGVWIDGAVAGQSRRRTRPRSTSAVGVVGLILVLEATRRSIGWALPILALVFLAYAALGRLLPDWLFPHRGYGVERIVGADLPAQPGRVRHRAAVMFAYVFLFVVFGALLESTGATQFIIDFARRLFGGTPGGPAKVAVRQQRADGLALRQRGGQHRDDRHVHDSDDAQRRLQGRRSPPASRPPPARAARWCRR